MRAKSNAPTQAIENRHCTSLLQPEHSDQGTYLPDTSGAIARKPRRRQDGVATHATVLLPIISHSYLSISRGEKQIQKSLFRKEK